MNLTVSTQEEACKQSTNQEYKDVKIPFDLFSDLLVYFNQFTESDPESSLSDRLQTSSGWVE